MEQSLEYQLLRRPRAWAREAPAIAITEGPKWAFRLLLLFLVVLYSNITVIYKSLETFRPAALMGLAAIAMMAIMIAGLVDPAVAFMIGTAVVLTINYPNPDAQRVRIEAHAKAARLQQRPQRRR